MEATVALYSAGGTLAVALGYVLLKRCRTSNCRSHTRFCDCDSPALVLARQQTERLEHIIEMLRNPAEDPEPHKDPPAVQI